MSSEKPRITYQEFQKHAAAANAAILALSQAVAASSLDAELQQLIKIRASQINGCAFCTQLHLNEARHMGISAPKLDLLVVWREAGVFSHREQAALAWTELLTRLSEHHISNEDYEAVSAHFAPRSWPGSAPPSPASTLGIESPHLFSSRRPFHVTPFNQQCTKQLQKQHMSPSKS